MKRAARPKKARRLIVAAFALTWDGTRWPVRALTPQSRAFLDGASRGPIHPPVETMARLLAAEDEIEEIRICWVPVLKGGDDTLPTPFPAPGSQCIRFRVVQQVRLKDGFGVVYRRSRKAAA